MNENRRIKRISMKFLLAIFIVISLITLLSVIPTNLSMRKYDMWYIFVPFSTALLCSFLTLFLSFPFFDFSSQKMNHSTYNYKFLTKKSYLHISFIVVIPLSLMIALIFLFQYQVDLLLMILYLISILLSYITTISTLVVIEQLSIPKDQVKNTKVNFKFAFSWIVLSLFILTAISQIDIYISFIFLAVFGIFFLCLFFISFSKFLSKERAKQTLDIDQRSKPVQVRILKITFTIITFFYYSLLILYVVFLAKEYLIIYFDEYVYGFFLAIQGSYVLFLIIFYSILYGIMIKKKMFE